MIKKYDIHSDFKLLSRIKNPKTMFSTKLASKVLELDFFLSKKDRLVREEKLTIKTEHNNGLDIIFFKPQNLNNPANTLIYFAGGAFMMAPASVHKRNLIYYAKKCNSIVALVFYRLAPKFPFPYAHYDAIEAFDYIYSHAKKFGIDRKKIVVGGDSAGGNLAAGVCLKNKELGKKRIAGQFLIYPFLDKGENSLSRKRFKDTPMFNSKGADFMIKNYFKEEINEELLPYAFPCLANNFENLPPAYIETAEFDCLKDDGIKYALSLDEANVPVVLNETIGTIHGFDAVRKSAVTKAALKERVKFLNNIFEKK